MGNILRGLNESSFADQFMKTMKDKGINARLLGSPEEEQERENQAASQRAVAKPTLSPEQVEVLKQRLAQAKQQLDPSYEYSDDYNVWAKNNAIAQSIRSIEKQLSDAGVQLNELSPQTLASYKKKAGQDASAADKAGDFERGNKRFSGIVRATKKQFSQDARGIKEGHAEFHGLRDRIERILIKAYQKFDTREEIINVAKAAAKKSAIEMGIDPNSEEFKEIWMLASTGHDVDTNFGDEKDDFDYTDYSMRQGERGVAEADKHSFIGRIQRHNELKRKVDSTWQDAADAERRGDKKGAARAFNKHVRYTNLERPGTWRDAKEQGEVEATPDTDAILYHLTSAFRKLVQNRDSYTNFANIQTVYDLMRDGLKKGDYEDFTRNYEYVLGRWPDAAGELIDAMFQDAGLGDNATIEDFIQGLSEGKLGAAAALAGAIALGGAMGYKHATKDPNAEPTKASQAFKTNAQRAYDAGKNLKQKISGDQKKESVPEDWQKVNKSDKTDGMSKKAVSAYRRENPGSKLQTAVTTKPSKLKKGSKAANRRKSFCARMSGMKKAHASAKTKRDPDSPINKALRRWNCESVEDLRKLALMVEQKLAEAKKSLRNTNPCWKGYEPVGTKKKNGKTVPNCVPVKKESSIMKGIVDENK